jgi:hypothetical protein
MISYQDGLVLHRHGDGFERMYERRDLDAADLDPERQWVKGSKAYQCPCGDVFVVGPSEAPDLEAGTPLAEPD